METIYEIVQIKQVVLESQVNNKVIRSPEDGAEIAYEFIGQDDREVLLVLCLNTKNRVIAAHRAHVGSINQSVAHPREIMKSCILNNAASFIIAHQHPSGEELMSAEDVQVGKRMKSAGDLMGIQMLDALVIGERNSNGLRFSSMKEKGDL